MNEDTKEMTALEIAEFYEGQGVRLLWGEHPVIVVNAEDYRKILAGFRAAAPSGVVEALPPNELRGLDQPWPLVDVLNKLIEAADILLDRKDHDGHGWELIHHARAKAKEYVAALSAAPKEGEQPARIGKLDWRTADGRYPPKEDENPVQYIQRLCRHIVNVECSNRGWNDAYGRLEESREKITGELRDLAKAKPNPELLVAAALHSLLKRHHQRSKDKFHGYESSKLGTETATTLTQWEASQPSPDSPKN